jgi:hypothetical protein
MQVLPDLRCRIPSARKIHLQQRSPRDAVVALLHQHQVFLQAHRQRAEQPAGMVAIGAIATVEYRHDSGRVVARRLQPHPPLRQAGVVAGGSEYDAVGGSPDPEALAGCGGGELVDDPIDRLEPPADAAFAAGARQEDVVGAAAAQGEFRGDHRRPLTVDAQPIVSPELHQVGPDLEWRFDGERLERPAPAAAIDCRPAAQRASRLNDRRSDLAAALPTVR